MNIFERTVTKEISFITMIGDLERGDGLIVYPAGKAAIRAVFQFFGHTVNGRPAAIYFIPGETGYALVETDSMQRSPYISKWLTREEAFALASRVPVSKKDKQSKRSSARRVERT